MKTKNSETKQVTIKRFYLARILGSESWRLKRDRFVSIPFLVGRIWTRVCMTFEIVLVQFYLRSGQKLNHVMELTVMV